MTEAAINSLRRNATEDRLGESHDEFVFGLGGAPVRTVEEVGGLDHKRPDRAYLESQKPSEGIVSRSASHQQEPHDCRYLTSIEECCSACEEKWESALYGWEFGLNVRSWEIRT